MLFASMVNIPETGIASLDLQRQELSDKISELLDSVAEGGPIYEEGIMLQSVYDHALGHFTQEEELFKGYGYPQAEAHVAEHQNMLEMVKRMVDRARGGGPSASPDAVAYLNDWLSHHVQEFDMAYSGFFEDRGVL